MFHLLLVFCLIVADSSSHSDQCIIVGIIWFYQTQLQHQQQQNEVSGRKPGNNSASFTPYL